MSQPTPKTVKHTRSFVFPKLCVQMKYGKLVKEPDLSRGELATRSHDHVYGITCKILGCSGLAVFLPAGNSVMRHISRSRRRVRLAEQVVPAGNVYPAGGNAFTY
jgi:hypothetical protein